MKELTELTQQDKDELYQIYTDNLNIPEEWCKETQKHFYKVILNFDAQLMPYCVVNALIERDFNIE